MDQQSDPARLIELAAEIVSAYVGHNRVQSSDLAKLIGDVHGALTRVENGPGEAAKPEQVKLTPQEIRRSITPDHLVSFEDGKRYKTLRRHLAGRGLDPRSYREKWGLSTDYPMVAPNYARQRSELARSIGLGQQRRKGLAMAPAEDAPGEGAKGSPVAQATTEPGSEETGAEPKRPRAPRAKTRKAERSTADADS